MLNTLIIALILVQPLETVSEESPAEAFQRKVNAKVERYAVSEDSFVQALAKVSAEFELPMGIEWVRTAETLGPADLSLKDVTVHQIISSIIQTQAGYDFEISDGFVHVFRKDLKDDTRNFLNLKIGKFQAQEEYAASIGRRLRDRVRRKIQPPEPPPPGGGGIGGSLMIGGGDRKISFQYEDVMVREILFRFVASTDLRIWIATFSDRPPTTKYGFRSVIATDGRAVSDAEQPVWQLLLWGSDPVSQGFRKDWRYRTPDGKVNLPLQSN